MDLATIDELLTTTRSVRRRLDLTRPVEREVIERCLEIAVQAPTGSNAQGWHFVVVTDAEKRRAIGALYERSFRDYEKRMAAQKLAADDPRAAQMPRVYSSASYLAEHMHEVPVLVIPCVEGRVETGPVVFQASLYGSILPAAWSFMLALRARGVGAAWTTLHLAYEKEIAALLGIPERYTQAALLPVAYYTGDGFKPAARLPVRERTSWNSWGAR
ncbi:MAG: nitroreductase family protein [bacterium]